MNRGIAVKNSAEIRSIHDLERLASPSRSLLCLFSGGLSSSFLISIASRLKIGKVTALYIELGSPVREDVKDFIASQGVELVQLPLVEKFADRFVSKAIKAKAANLAIYPLLASLSRPFIAQEAFEYASLHGFDSIIHASTGSGNNSRRFNQAFDNLGFAGMCGSPFENSEVSRASKIRTLREMGALKFYDYSEDVNIWGRESGFGSTDSLEEFAIAEGQYLWTQINIKRPARVMLEFDRGALVRVDGNSGKLCVLLSELNSLVGSCGLGRYVGLEEIESGFKVQKIREMPAAFLICDAILRLESACLEAECLRLKGGMEQIWAREVVEGRWFGHLREAAEDFIGRLSLRVSGEVEYELGEMRAVPLSVRAKDALYVRNRKEFEVPRRGI
jgi:argininosuccinate synthase